MDYLQLINKNVMSLDLVPYLNEWETKTKNIEKLALRKKHCEVLKTSFEEGIKIIHIKHRVTNNDDNLKVHKTKTILKIAFIKANNNYIEKIRRERNILIFNILRFLDNITPLLWKIFKIT